MKRRTIVLALEVEGPTSDSLRLRDFLQGMRYVPRGERIVRVEILDDGISPTRQRESTGQGTPGSK
jgi:hypothetical protein